MTYATINEFDYIHHPVTSTGWKVANKKYLVLSQPEMEPKNGFNLVIQDQDDGEIFQVQSIDFKFEDETDIV